ncbi:MAG: methanogen output domain 1-containing protein [Nanoarchaeota archaeon]
MKKNIETSIIDFIKKSPLGVTSSELAKFLGINRVTLTKYLAVVKEKAKIDFKQFGMAKLWYIPVDINQLKFFKDMIIDTCKNLDAKSTIERFSKKTGKHISDIYRRFYGTTILIKGQLVDSIIDAMNKLGGNFNLLEEDDGKLVFRNTKCIFGKNVKDCPKLCAVTLNIIKSIVDENLDNVKVELQKTIARGSAEDIITVYL